MDTSASSSAVSSPVEAFKKDPLSITSIEALLSAAETLSPDDKLRAFQAMAATVTTAEIWARVGILRAARKMVCFSYSPKCWSCCPHTSHLEQTYPGDV